MRTKRWIAASGILLAVCILVLLACGAVNEYWNSQQMQYRAEARDAGYQERISARLYSIEQCEYNGEPYYLVNYGNRDMFGGSYSDYAIIPLDTVVHKSVKVDRWMYLYYSDSQKVQDFTIDGHSEYCELLDAYMMIGKYDIPNELWLGAILGALLSGGICIIFAIVLGVQCYIRKKKNQGGEAKC